MSATRMTAVMQQHVKADGVAPHEPREAGNRVVVLFSRTGACRLFDKLDSVGNWYSIDAYDQHVYVTPRQMSLKLTDGVMLNCIGWLDLNSMREAKEEGLKGLSLADALWRTCQKWGSHVTREFPQAVNRESDARKFVVNLALLASPEGQALLEKKPRQCQVVAQAIKHQAQSVMSDDEMDSMARRIHTSGQLKTKQDPCRIVRYYLPTLAELGMVEYQTRKVREGEDEDYDYDGPGAREDEGEED